jgi:hypothetical protein
MNRIPNLPAYTLPDSVAYIVWCEYCRCWHWHGTGGETPDELAADKENHRVAHCHNRDSPYKTGYFLRYAGPASPEIIQDLRRRRPKAPASEEFVETGAHSCREISEEYYETEAAEVAA